MGRTRRFSFVNSDSGAVLALVVFLGAILFSGELASAQTVFCPVSVSSVPTPVNSVPNVMQISGNCTNPTKAGAASGSALASQAIGDLAGSSTNEETSVARKAIGERRDTPPEACPSGEILIDGICKPQPSPGAGAALGLPGVDAALTAEVGAAPDAAKHRKT